MAVRTQILMATYNGAAYLPYQLESIQRQSYTGWSILARDDGSTDNTVAILEDFADRHPHKLNLIKGRPERRLGAAGNFVRLMEQSTAETVFFADQDDIWYADKMRRSILQLRELKARHGPHMPILVHHDFAVIDKDGHQTHASFDYDFNRNKADSRMARMLTQGIVHGFSMAANRALIDRALPTPSVIAMHDQHLSFVARATGVLAYIPAPLAQYRIHDTNTTSGIGVMGKREWGKLSLTDLFSANALPLVRELSNTARSILEQKCRVADSFATRYKGEISEETERLVRDFAALSQQGPIDRRVSIIKNGFLPHALTHKLGFLALG